MDNRENQVLYTPTQKAVPAVADLSSFYQSYEDINTKSDASSGTNILSLSATPLGVVRIVTVIAAVNYTTAINEIIIRSYISGNARGVINNLNPAITEFITFSGQVVLDENDYVEAIFNDCSAGDMIRIYALGYDVKRY